MAMAVSSTVFQAASLVLSASSCLCVHKCVSPPASVSIIISNPLALGCRTYNMTTVIRSDDIHLACVHPLVCHTIPSRDSVGATGFYRQLDSTDI